MSSGTDHPVEHFPVRSRISVPCRSAFGTCACRGSEPAGTGWAFPVVLGSATKQMPCKYPGRYFQQLVPLHWSTVGPDQHPTGMTKSRRLKRCNIVPFQQPVQIRCVFYFSSMDGSLRVYLESFLWSGPSHIPVIVAQWWRGKGKSCHS